MSAQSFPSLIVHTKKGKAVWFAAMGFSSIVHVAIFQGLALDNSKAELKPRVTIIALKEIISEHPASLTYPKRPTPQIPLPELTSVTTIAPTSVTSATTLTEASALLPSTSLSVAPEMPDEALKSPENLLPKEIDSYLPEIKVEFESSVQLQLEPELSMEVEPRSIIGAKAQVITTQAAETREKIEVFDKAEAEKSRIFQKSRAQKVFEMARAGAKKEIAVERMKIAQEKMRIAKEREVQLAAKLEREQLDAQKAMEIERLKIIHERKAMEAAEIEEVRLKALKGSAAERLRIIQDGKGQQAAEPGDVRLKVRQENKVDIPGIAKEQRQQILQATERIKIASQKEIVLKDIKSNAGAKKEVAVERLRIAQEKLRIAQEKLRIAQEKKVQLVAKLEREQLDVQKAVEIERLKIIHERKAMEAAEIEEVRLKALKGSAAERLRIVQDGKGQQAAEPGHVRLKVRQEVKVDRPGIAEEQSRQIQQATERIKIASQEETILEDIQTNYEESLVAELARHKRYPLSAQRRGHQAVIWVSFKINTAGSLISFKLESPSRYKDLNRAVESMFKLAFPVSPVPKELRGAQKEFWYTLPVEFRI